MDYSTIINQVIAETIEREVKSRLEEKDDEITSLKGLLGDRGREVAKLVDEISELKRSYRLHDPLDNVLRNQDAEKAKEEIKKKDQELITIRGTVLERGRMIESLQVELKGVRDALKNHVDSEDKLRKELDSANTRITELDAMVNERDTRIEYLEAESDEKDRLIEKYKDMSDAISDWANNDMPSLDPDDY